ncbi:UNVERIFIED_CONTAM: hypothetical protein PYX00_007129 [Menopon gallinae]|uniref:Telomerase reverse transcriptase n=1 Tax=Menopon gallinae TaxID=328185 RepID=A0AAW2HIM7_9NEOP
MKKISVPDEYRHRRRKKYENTLRNLLEEKKKQASEDSIEGSFNRETFNKGRILYDIKQRRWPKSHALSCGSVNSVLTSIMRVKRNGVKSIENQLLENSNCLKGIFRAILERHKTIVHNDGYGRILKCHLKGFRWAKGSLESISVGAVSSYIIDILRRVIPIEFFGGNRLKKKFMSEVSKIISGSKYEGFIFETLIQMFLEIKDELSWLREIQEFVDARTIILKILIWLILDYVLLIIRNNFYVTDVGSFGYQLYYYRKGDMERAVAQWVNSRLRKKTISLVEGDLEHWDNAERKWIETGRIENAPRICMPKSTEWIFPVSRIRFLPKSIESDELRVITNFKLKKIFTRRRQVKKYKLCQSFFKRIVNRLKMLKKVKGLLQFLVENYGTGITPMPDNPKLKKAWKKAFLLKQLHGKLYFVKADINDAFGSIVPSLLGAIIEEKLKVKSNQVMHLRKIVECRMKYGKIQCRVRESFSDRPKENCLLISRSYLVGKKRKLPSYKSKYLKKILDQIIQNQYMSINGKIYRLTTGVTQGSAGALSALLCEIYCSEMDRLYFTEFMTCSECILLRGVDDYLLITSSPEKAGKFYDIVYNGVKDFNVTFNRSKLKSNINEDISSFRYLGLIFDVKDMTVRPDYSKYGGKDLLSTMKLPYWKDPLSSLGMSSLKLLAITVGNSYTSSAVCREIVFAACHLGKRAEFWLFPGIYSGIRIRMYSISETHWRGAPAK